MNKDNKSNILYVRDYDYNNIGTYEDKNRFSDVHELEVFLDKIFIPNNIAFKRSKNKNCDDDKYLSIQFNKILSLKCSNEEIKYIMNYLNDRGIHVGGFVSTLEGEYDNYDYIHTYNLSDYPISMTNEEQEMLFKKLEFYKENNDKRKFDIMKKIAEGSLRLIRYVTYKYSLFTEIDINELDSYGCEGLMTAIDRFDPKLGYKFSTFACIYIKNYVNDGLRIIRGFEHNKDFYKDFIKCKTAVENGYSEECGEKITLNDDPNMLDDIINLMIDTCGISSKKELKLRNKLYVLYPTSYDLCTDLVYDYDVEEEYIRKERILLIREILNSIPEKEKNVIIKRFGFDSEKVMTLEEIGNIYNMTKEGIRQIEKKAKSRFLDKRELF